jgi:AraC-like DNA-binding protein
MRISFKKLPGNPGLGIAFFWKLAIETRSPVLLRDHFVPELFWDFFHVVQGQVGRYDEARGRRYKLPRQALKPLYNRPLKLVYQAPLVMYGARLTLAFVESFWEETKANRFVEQAWVKDEALSLEAFKVRVLEQIQRRRISKLPYPLFKNDLQESDWLIHYSPRHKRRLYAATFGLSRKELLNIHNVQAFLKQTCDFGARNPRIIQHIDPAVFYDQPHLNRTFKKLTGFAPVEYFDTSSILQDNLMSASYNAE